MVRIEIEGRGVLIAGPLEDIARRFEDELVRRGSTDVRPAISMTSSIREREMPCVAAIQRRWSYARRDRCAAFASSSG